METLKLTTATHAPSVRSALIDIASCSIGLSLESQIDYGIEHWNTNNWTDFLAEVQHEDLHAWISHRLAHFADRVPSFVSEQLNAQHARRSQWSRLQAQLGVQVLDALTRAGVPARVYKGQALAQAVYGDTAFRDASDVDVIVPSDRANAAGDVLRGLGFSSSIAAAWLSDARFINQHREITFSDLGAFHIDLHWKMVNRWNRACVTENELFTDHGARLALPNGVVPWFAPDVLWRVQLSNIVSGDWRGLKAFVDLAHTSDHIGREGLERAAARCFELGCRDYFWVALLVMRSLMPREVLRGDSSDWGAPSFSARAASHRIARQLRNGATRVGFWESFSVNLLAKPDWQSFSQLLALTWRPATADFVANAPSTSSLGLVASTIHRRMKALRPASD